METLRDYSNALGIAFFVTCAVSWYVYNNPQNCESIMTAYLSGMFGIAGGYVMGKAAGNKPPEVKP